jgi:hypothetical protein
MNSTSLRQIIKESIQEYIREVETSGNVAAQEAKIRACDEAIELREKKLNMEGLDEAYHDMIDEAKKKNLEKEIKELQKYKKKAEKILEKMKSKAGKEDTMENEGMGEEAVIDEVAIDEMDPEAGPQLEEIEEARFEKGTDIGKKGKGFAKIAKSAAKRYGSEEAGERVAGAILKKVLKKEEKEMMNESFLYMQKLAGLITENEYKEKIKEVEEVEALFEEETEDLLSLIQSYVSYDYTEDQGYGTFTDEETGEEVDVVDNAREEKERIKVEITRMKGSKYFSSVEKIASLLTYDAEYANAKESEEIQPQLEELAAKLGFTLDQIQSI